MSTPTAAQAADGIVPQTAAPIVPKQRGTVKSVISGDTLVVQDEKPSAQGPPAEHQITFSSLSAPRLARFKVGEDSQKEKDEPFAWESREFLRSKIIGKKVGYTIEFHNAKSNRDYATVWLGSGEGAECLNHSVISEGWATVLRSQSGKDKELKEPLIQLEEAAKAAGKGIHTKDKVKLENAVRPTPAVEAVDLIGRLKNKPLTAIVERITNGSTMRVTLLPTFHNISILLSGVQCPRLPRDKPAAAKTSAAGEGEDSAEGSTTSTASKDAETQPGEPFAREAKYFVEQNILNREVKINLEGVDQQGNFFGSIESATRDVAEELLKAGLAKYVAFSAAQRGHSWVAKLKAAEQSAKDGKRRIFANYVAPSVSDTASAEVSKKFEGKVTSVQNVGTLLVTPEGGPEIQVNLSSLRLPRVGYPGDEKEEAAMRNEEDGVKKVAQYKFEKVWAAEAKEWLRKRLIGQKVRCVLDNVRKATDKQPERSYYSVYWGDKLESNLAVSLVDNGFAWVMTYKGGEDRSNDYEALIIADGKAKASHKGLHGSHDAAPVKRYNDVCVDAKDKKARANQISKAKSFVSFFQRGQQHKCIIDYVFSGARFKLTLPGQTCVLIFAISGLRVPRREDEDVSAGGEEGEEENKPAQPAAVPGQKTISDEALAFTRDRLHQREASVEILSVDNGGNFVGNLYIGKKNFGLELLSNGYAYVQESGAERVKDDFYAAEATAKKNKLRLWKNYDEEAEKKKQELSIKTEEDATAAASDKPSKGEVLVTEVLDGARVYIQFINTESAGLNELVTKLTELSITEGNIPEIKIKTGDIVRAQFTDNSWYRAKVTSVSGDSATVLYIDYGNTEKLQTNKIRALPKNFQALPPQAQEGILAFAKPLSADNDYAIDAKDELKDLTNGRKLIANIEYREQGILGLSLVDAEDGVDVNVAMMDVGLLRLQRHRKWFSNNALYNRLKTKQEAALRSRKGIWAMGDIGDSDDDEDVRGGGRGSGAPSKPKASSVKSSASGSSSPAAKPAAAKKK